MTNKTPGGRDAADVQEALTRLITSWSRRESPGELARGRLLKELRHPLAVDGLREVMATAAPDIRDAVMQNELVAEEPAALDVLREKAKEHANEAVLMPLAAIPSEQDLVVRRVVELGEDPRYVATNLFGVWGGYAKALAVAGAAQQLVEIAEAHLSWALASMRCLDRKENNAPRPMTERLDKLLEAEFGGDTPKEPLDEDTLCAAMEVVDATFEALALLGPTSAMTERLLTLLGLCAQAAVLHPAYRAL